MICERQIPHILPDEPDMMAAVFRMLNSTVSFTGISLPINEELCLAEEAVDGTWISAARLISSDSPIMSASTRLPASAPYLHTGFASLMCAHNTLGTKTPRPEPVTEGAANTAGCSELAPRRKRGHSTTLQPGCGTGARCADETVSIHSSFKARMLPACLIGAETKGAMNSRDQVIGFPEIVTKIAL
ncbi:hypothetical protein Anapl_00317 [Anas platyrhynchos]|uniref:Uncharacterized protein n=1 Tax=Anas platyrhynchos TaxID=8839 RepID=R0LQS5_ANAPL|nr:hypothetical protein Anapl_00317 [Anas platyrhynchos]